MPAVTIVLTRVPPDVRGERAPEPPKKAKIPRHLWRADELEMLRSLAPLRLPTRVIALRLGRSSRAVYTKASREGISLKHEQGV
jgi:hypothetical protein